MAGVLLREEHLRLADVDGGRGTKGVFVRRGQICVSSGADSSALTVFVLLVLEVVSLFEDPRRADKRSM